MKEEVENYYQLTCKAASKLGLTLEVGELASLASDNDMGESELKALSTTFDYLEQKRTQATIETLLRLSRLPKKVPKTFDNFVFSRVQGKDVNALSHLPALSDFYAQRNIAFIGPGGVGKTHLSQAYGRECCLKGYKSYYIKATELRDKFAAAIKRGNTSRVVGTLVKPSCLIIDEIGRCEFDKACTNLFFDVVDRRYEKEGPNTMILTSNTVASEWTKFFEGNDTLMCALDRIFDHASVFMMQGVSYRGSELDTYSVEIAPQVQKTRGI